MPIKNKTEVMVDKVHEQVVAAVDGLFQEHKARVSEAIEESEGRKLNVSFSCRIDFSESVGTVDTHIGYSQVTKDKRHADIDPPEQMQIPGTERDADDGDIKEEYVDGNGRPVDMSIVVPMKPKRARKKKGE